MGYEPWPVQDLEAVPACPFCTTQDRRLAFEAVQDWAFGCAPGLWNYWDCRGCRALYLDPRPTQASIGKAYAQYYTHARSDRASLAAKLKQRLRNEYWSQTLHTSIAPRIGLPHGAGWTVDWLGRWIAEPFGLRQWADLPKGLLIDVGCGNGDKLKLANQLGWQTVGIELDTSAVQAAQSQGLTVVQGGYELLADYQGRADCVVCSHVLEHVHQPMQLLQLLLASLSPQGVLLLSAPNASSSLRSQYAENWRGLEAPRHLGIPDGQWLMQWLRAQGFVSTQLPSHPLETAIESERMRRRGLTVLPDDIRAARKLLRGQPTAPSEHQDVVQLICKRQPSNQQQVPVDAP